MGTTPKLKCMQCKALYYRPPSIAGQFCSQRCAGVASSIKRNAANTKTFATRFWARVQKSRGGCWEWTAGKTGAGYGTVRRLGVDVQTHVASWWLSTGQWPDKFVLHHCDNRTCVRPSHLFLGTHADNMHDMVIKGRSYSRHGDKNPNVKLTWQRINQIRKLYSTGKYRQIDIAEMFGVKQAAISRIVRGTQWKR